MVNYFDEVNRQMTIEQKFWFLEATKLKSLNSQEIALKSQEKHKSHIKIQIHNFELLWVKVVFCKKGDVTLQGVEKISQDVTIFFDCSSNASDFSVSVAVDVAKINYKCQVCHEP